MRAPSLQTERPPALAKGRAAEEQATFPTLGQSLTRARKLGNNTEGGPRHVWS